MSRKVALRLTASAVALAAFGFAGTAMALPPVGNNPDAQHYGVPVNITVEPNVSVWAGAPGGPPPISLDMNGVDGNNSATAAEAVHRSYHVDATIDVSVDGTLPNPVVPGGGINFFIFQNTTPVAAVAAISANSYTPAGALAWKQSTLGDTYNLIPSTGIVQSAATDQILYASDAPEDPPLADTCNLVATYTISAL